MDDLYVKPEERGKGIGIKVLTVRWIIVGNDPVVLKVYWVIKGPYVNVGQCF